ncbi:MAG: hypothetical protein J2P21_03325 [Chloracidobacterium sp.]|nr:hypothetical protein [Chloracidobacterium sp.]
MLSQTFDGLAKTAIGMALLILISMVYSGEALSQTPHLTDSDPKRLHGGIEIALRSVRSVALRVSTDADGDNIPRIQGSDQIIPSTPFPGDQKLTPEYISDLAKAVQTLSEKLHRDYSVPQKQIYLLGLSEIASQDRNELSKEVREKIGKEITFLDAKGETELNIASNIPRRYQSEGKWYDNRSISLLLDISATNIRGGYQQLSLERGGGAQYDYITWDIPLKSQLRAEAAQNPGLMTRRKIYLMGNIASALAALLYPADQQPYLPISMADINNFYYRAITDPEALLNPDLSKIRDEKARNEAKKWREAVKSVYTPKTLVAGAQALRTAVIGLNLADKRLIIPRNSDLARVLSFVRLQIE